MTTFERKIRAALRWMRVAAFARGLAFGFAVSAAVVLVSVLLQKWLLPSVRWDIVVAICAAIILFSPVLFLVSHRLTRVKAALALDEFHGTRERFVTALHALKRGTVFADAIIADAESHAAAVHPRRVANFRIAKPAASACLLALIAGSIHFYAPEYDLFRRKEQVKAAAAEKQVVEQETQKLAELEKKLERQNHDSGPPDSAEKIAQEIRELQRQIGKDSTASARDTMAKISSLSDKISEEKEKLRKRSQAQLNSGKKQPEANRQTAQLERALRRGDMEKARAELKRLEERSAAQGRSAQDNRKLGEELGQLGKSVAGQEALSNGLEQAGAGLETADAKAAKEGFENALAALDGIESLQKEMQQLEEALTELEQSKANLAAAANGQGENSSNSGQGQSGAEARGGEEGQAGEGSAGQNNAQSGQDGQAQQGGTSEGSGQQNGGNQQNGSGQEGDSSGSAQSGSSQGSQFNIGSGKSQSGQSAGGSNQQGGSEQSTEGQMAQAGGQQGGAGSEAGGQGQQASGQGSQSGSQSASGQQSSSGQSGEQSGSGNGNGSGPDWGVGTTNLDQASGYEAKAKPGDSRQSNRDSNWTEQFVKLYDARSIETQQHSQQAKGKIGEGSFDYSTDVEGSPTGEAPRTDARKAFLDYREAQKDSLAKEDIPMGYKEYVKNYFDSIEPPE